MYAAVHPWAVINGGINPGRCSATRRRHGATAHDSEQRHHVGLGQRREPGQSDPAVQHAAWAVTGKMVGGTRALRRADDQPRGRVDRAHPQERVPRRQENSLGSIQPGKLADLVVLDRDYLTIPADQIKDIRPVMTMVGGEHLDANGEAPRAVACQMRNLAS